MKKKKKKNSETELDHRDQALERPRAVENSARRN